MTESGLAHACPALPSLATGLESLDLAFRIALGDLAGNIQPFMDGLLTEKKPCILAGLEYDTPWTRDAAINVWNGAGLLFPEASRDTLLSVLTRDEDGIRIGGQYWDAIIWTTGAWAYYLYSGDTEFLATALEASRNSLGYFERTEFDTERGLFRGPACYGDGVAAYPDRYARTGGSSSILEWPRCNPGLASSPGYGIPIHALSTNCLYYNAYIVAARMARELGLPREPSWDAKAEALRRAIDERLWDPRLNRYRYLDDPWGGCDFQEGLGASFVLLFGVASPERAEAVVQSQYVSPQGIPCVWPSFPRYQRESGEYGRHSGTVWPHVQGFWAEAAARRGAVDKFAFELFKLAMLATRDGQFAELYHPVTGEIYGGLQEGQDGPWHSCLRQTWSATAYLRMVLIGLCGMDFSAEGIAFAPRLSEGIERVELAGLRYRRQTLHLTISGKGSNILSFYNNGQLMDRPFLPAKPEGLQDIRIVLA